MGYGQTDWRQRFERLGEAIDRIEDIDGVHLETPPSDVQAEKNYTSANIELAVFDEVLDDDD